ncbi:hypothetical protein ACFFSW_18395 [Saccharothrix longispora]|uniref:Copper(I)-binding protein n=1 Tax=Saccharothrix longispora TaxID=33920 RepID=A0ABU1Q4D0_9PSEU|nr:hypothetical protein [Saccharothrix longispora]MDR6597755.1 copper(I)-binding protein [Saccharothrix longispora]
MGRAHQKSAAPRRLAVVAALATGLGLFAAGCGAGQITQTDQQVAAVNGASGQAGTIAVRDAQFLFPAEHGAYEEGDDAPIVVVIANNGTEADRLLAVTSESADPAQIEGDVELEPGSSVLGGGDPGTAGDGETSSVKPTSSSVSPTSGSPAPSSGSVPTTGSASSTGSAPGSATTTTGSPTPDPSVTTTTGGNTSISNPPTTSGKNPSSAEPVEPGQVRIVLKNLKKTLRPGETIRVTFLFEKAGEVTLELPIGATSEPREDAPSGH